MSEKENSKVGEVYGVITHAGSDQAAAGLKVVAMDADMFKDDRLGQAIVDKSGHYRITYDWASFSDQFERAPDVYLLLYDKDGSLILSTKNSTIHDADSRLEINLEIPGRGDIPPTRSQFTRLILSNPNYFGSMPDIGLDPVELMSGNKTYEELICLGYHPELERLEAVVVVKQPYGYGTDPCGTGSTEYVRFFVERGGVWQDLGVDSFKVYNMPGSDHPLCYTASISLSEPEKHCAIENLMNVRAILSWNQEPPAGNAAWPPPWGNSLDATVQIDAWKLPLIAVKDLISEGLLKVDESLLSQLKFDEPLPLQPPAPLTFPQLKELYANEDVPPHRFGFVQAMELTERSVTSDLMAQVIQGAQNELAGGLGLIPGPELAGIFEELGSFTDHMRYEELLCAGYNPATREVGGVISIKRNSGYSGGLCTAGSKEYVGFWVEYGGSWHELGVAEVEVYDLSGVGGGNTVEYAVFRATNAVPEMPCEDLTGLPLRAILSWNKPPTGPDFPPTWGNVVNTFIQPPIGEPLIPGQLNRLRLMSINRAPVEDPDPTLGISDITGRSNNPSPVAPECGGIDRPFGGKVYIEGDFVVKPDVFNHVTGDVLPGQHPILYRVFYRKDDSAADPTQIVDPFNIRVYPESATTSVVKTQNVTPFAGNDYYTYMESDTQAVNPRLLAVWHAGGLEDGLYELTVESMAWDGLAYVPLATVHQKIYIYNGYPHMEAVLQPDGTVEMVERRRPELILTLTGGECADIAAGAVISGSYTVRDYFFRQLQVNMVPLTIGGVTHVKSVTITNPGSVVPHAGVEPTLQIVSGTWTMDTSGLPPCGYTIELKAWDRALANYNCGGHYNRIGVGFCLREPGE